MRPPNPARKRKRLEKDSSSSADEDEAPAVVDYEEALVSACPSSRTYAPPSFWTREVYQELFNQGLCVLPAVPGMGLRYHKAGQQWEAHSPYSQRSVEPKWSPTLRSEKRAIFMCLDVPGIHKVLIFHGKYCAAPRTSGLGDSVLYVVQC